MKITILTPSIYMYKKRFGERIFAPGDLARALVDGLVAKGHEVFWYTAPGEKTSATIVPGDQTLLENDLKIRAFQDIEPAVLEKMSLFGTKMYYELDLVSRVYADASEKKIDIVHVFHSFGYLAQFFAQNFSVPTVFTLHDPIPTHDMLESWLIERFPPPAYIAISKAQQKHLGDHFVGTVYNGIDIESFTFSSTPGASFLSVGRMVPEKGFDIAIRVALLSHEKLTIASWITDSVKGSSYYKEKILPYIDNKDIVLHSLLDKRSLNTMYKQAKALLFPLMWEEPFGLVMTEAMACGTPVIAYNRGSAAEIVKDGVTGFIIDPDDVDRPGKGTWVIKKQGIEGLVEAMKRVYELDRKACRAHVEANFSFASMTDGYENVYRTVKNNNGHPSID